jgi:hypothetical protein
MKAQLHVHKAQLDVHDHPLATDSVCLSSALTVSVTRQFLY